MRKVLAVITAIALVAIVFAPAMGYTISSESKPAFSANAEKNSNYTIGMGKPAHETEYSAPMAKSYPVYSVKSTPMPYTFNSEKAAGYSLKLVTASENVNALGGYKSSVQGVSGTIGKGIVTETESAQEQPTVAETPATETKEPAINATAPSNASISTIPTGNVTAK
jgi:hypothetical protein